MKRSLLALTVASALLVTLASSRLPLQAIMSPDATPIPSTPAPPTVAVVRTVPFATPAAGARPPGTTGRCCDASYTTARWSQDACRDHGGICEWWGP